MKKSLSVLSLFKDQSLFMTIIMGLLNFLAILALGLTLAIASGIYKWNTQWQLFTTVQITNRNNVDDVKKIIDKNRKNIDSVKLISESEMKQLLKPWLETSGNTLEKYLPITYELKFKNTTDLQKTEKQLNKYANVITHAKALKTSISAGYTMITISVLVLLLVLGTIGICVSYISKNTAKLHSRELEILNQVGASDSFVVQQMKIIITKLCFKAGYIGLLVAIPFLLLILSMAHSAKIGLLSTMNLSVISWIFLILLPMTIAIIAIFIAKKTTLKILQES